MSRVFLAEEISLGRKVVVKVLSSDVIAGISGERFAREVRLAASLQHPNIVPVLSTGITGDIPYYTMPYVRGASLRTRMNEAPPLGRRPALAILRDVARALQYAHAEGVVHRDIKPENVLLSGDQAVVTDFGIAKAISVARTSAAPEVATGTESGFTLTQAGVSVGTPAYMSPEQVAGDPVDNRTDIYAWGLVAYELLASGHPFAGLTTAAQLMAAQLSQQPSPLEERAPDISPLVADVVMRCLEKNPDKRPGSAAQVLEVLDEASDSGTNRVLPRPAKSKRTYTMSAVGLAILLAIAGYAFFTRGHRNEITTNKSSVAVLPFADLRADSAEAYFGEGIADELMTALARVPGLRVASRTSAIAVARQRDLDVREIGKRLGVSTVVEGTVRRDGGRLRVTAQLTNAADGLTLWSDAFERENKDVFAVQDEITNAIVAALRPELAGGVKTIAQKTAMGPGTNNPEAYDLYLRGLYLIERRGPGVAQSAEYFSEAIRKDSSFARAYAGLADALELFPYFAGVPASRVEARVRAAAERSLQLDSSLAEPRVALGMAHMHAYRWSEAEQEFKQALAADSASPVAHTQYGRFLLSVGRVPDALREFRTARRLDPLAGTASMWLSHTLAYAGDQSAAWEESKRARELDPNLVTSRTILPLDRLKPVPHFADARAIVGTDVPPIPFNGMMAYTLQSVGDTAQASAIRKRLDATPDTTWLVHMARAIAYLATPDTAKALSEMEAGLARREFVPQWMPLLDRMFDPVRRSVRFAEIVRRSGLEGRGLTGPNGGRPAP
jgi:TolB-like protein/tetratricopeptide (TPR) repeat protein